MTSPRLREVLHDVSDGYPAEITIYVRTDGDLRLKPYIDRSVLVHPYYMRVVREGGQIVVRNADAPDGCPMYGVVREGRLAGVPNDVEYDWWMRGLGDRDSEAGWKRAGTMHLRYANMAGEAMVRRCDVEDALRRLEDPLPKRVVLDAVGKPPPTYPVGPWTVETDWEGRMRNGGLTVNPYIY